ncbi:MAG: HEAT repeat domain-containing protein [Methanocalculaceae archaeon]|jgi:hypothetical protein|nr:HEAT repeat domain-containing protein [Methanocalculaceae archaeon]
MAADLGVCFRSLCDASLNVRHAAVEEIATVGRVYPGDVVPAVIAELIKATPDRCWYLGRSLVKMGAVIIPIMLKYAELEENMDVQKYFGAVLASFGDAAILPLISLFSSANPMTRGMVSAALVQLEATAVPALIRAAQDDDPQIKLCIELTLTKLHIFDYSF